MTPRSRSVALLLVALLSLSGCNGLLDGTSATPTPTTDGTALTEERLSVGATTLAVTAERRLVERTSLESVAPESPTRTTGLRASALTDPVSVTVPPDGVSATLSFAVDAADLPPNATVEVFRYGRGTGRYRSVDSAFEDGTATANVSENGTYVVALASAMERYQGVAAGVVIDDVRVDTDDVDPGDQVRFSGTVHARAGTHDDLTFTLDDSPVATAEGVVAEGESRSFEYELSYVTLADRVPPGTYRVGAVADGARVVTNATLTVGGDVRPDVEVESVAVDRVRVGEAESVTFSAVVANENSYAFADGVTFTLGGVPAFTSTGEIGPSERRRYTYEITYERFTGRFAPGTYALGVRTAGGNVTSETEVTVAGGAAS